VRVESFECALQNVATFEEKTIDGGWCSGVEMPVSQMDDEERLVFADCFSNATFIDNKMRIYVSDFNASPVIYADKMGALDAANTLKRRLPSVTTYEIHKKTKLKIVNVTSEIKVLEIK
jgi:hypothetical protein